MCCDVKTPASHYCAAATDARVLLSQRRISFPKKTGSTNTASRYYAAPSCSLKQQLGARSLHPFPTWDAQVEMVEYGWFDLFMLLLLGSVMLWTIYSLCANKKVRKDFAHAWEMHGRHRMKRGDGYQRVSTTED